MRKPAFLPCLPSRGQGSAGSGLDPRSKHDGYRLIVQIDGKRVRLFTRNGHDWTERYPLIVEAALRNRIKSFVVDGADQRCVQMRCRDVDYTVVQGVGGQIWKWGFAMDGEVVTG